MKKILSPISQLKTPTFKSDFIAGVTVSLILIPQSMAYAQLAGLPPYYGLYASLLPPVIASLFGSSNHLSTGPVAIASLMTAAALAPIATSESEYILLAATLALILGLSQIVFGFLRLGALVNLLSHPVIVGFTNAAAIIIATSQLPKILGVSAGTAERHYETVVHVLKEATVSAHYPTIIMGVGTFLLMYLLKKVAPKLPYILIALITTTTISWVLQFQKTESIQVTQIASVTIQEQVKSYNSKYTQINDLKDSLVLIDQELERQDISPEEYTNALIIQSDISGLIQKHENELIELRKELARHRLSFDTHNGQYVSPPTSRNRWQLHIPLEPIHDANLQVVGGGAIVGAIPEGLPSLTLPKLSLATFLELIPIAAIISLIAFAEAISIAQAIAAKTKQRINANKELIGQGMGNVVAAFSQGYPVAGSFSRSAVNVQAGAQTKLSSVVTGSIVLITLLFFTKLLFYIPQAALAAIIILAVGGLIDFNKIRYIWRTSRADAFASSITFISTLFYAPELEMGLFIGVGFSLIYYLYQNTNPRVSTLSLYKDGQLHDTRQFGLARCENIAVLRFNAPLFFANANVLEDKIIRELAQNPKLTEVLLVGTSMSNIDATGEEKIHRLIDHLRENGKDIYFSALQKPVMDVFRKTNLVEKVGKDHMFVSVEDAVRYLVEHAAVHTDKDHCPLLKYVHEEHEGPAASRHAVQNVYHIFRKIFPTSLVVITVSGLENIIGFLMSAVSKYK